MHPESVEIKVTLAGSKVGQAITTLELPQSGSGAFCSVRLRDGGMAPAATAGCVRRAGQLGRSYLRSRNLSIGSGEDGEVFVEAVPQDYVDRKGSGVTFLSEDFAIPLPTITSDADDVLAAGTSRPAGRGGRGPLGQARERHRLCGQRQCGPGPGRYRPGRQYRLFATPCDGHRRPPLPAVSDHATARAGRGRSRFQSGVALLSYRPA